MTSWRAERRRITTSHQFVRTRLALIFRPPTSPHGRSLPWIDSSDKHASWHSARARTEAMRSSKRRLPSSVTSSSTIRSRWSRSKQIWSPRARSMSIYSRGEETPTHWPSSWAFGPGTMPRLCRSSDGCDPTPSRRADTFIFRDSTRSFREQQLILFSRSSETLIRVSSRRCRPSTRQSERSKRGCPLD